MREIGSEFQYIRPDNGRGLAYPRPGSLVFSGRTAIEAVLMKLPEARTALLPSYCCDSMIVPFRAAGIDVDFYKVEWDSGLKIEIDGKADILVWCNYFGFHYPMLDFDGVIIEDITHSFLSNFTFHPQSDYLVASLRKWNPILCGGYCSIEAEGVEPPEKFVENKKMAMELKTEYLEDLDKGKKSKFLQIFSDSNHWLAENYSGFLIDSWSRDFLKNIDIEKQRRIRRENAKILYEGLRNRVRFMFPESDMDCPLFVPILIPNRDEVRAYLIKNEIYCPVHWPKPEGCDSNIYSQELSLICDQRYGSEDMERIVSTIKEVL